MELYHHSPTTHSLHGAQLKHGDNFTSTFTTVKGLAVLDLLNSALKIMFLIFCLRYDFNLSSQEWQHESKIGALQTKFGPCPPTPIYDR